MEPNPSSLKHETVMDVTEEQVARVYAQGLPGRHRQFAECDGSGRRVGFVRHRRARTAFPSSSKRSNRRWWRQEQKEQLLGRIFGGRASTEVLNFLKVLSRHGRLGIVRQVSRLATKLHATQRGMTDVEIRVATPLDDALRGEIQNRLRKVLGTEPVLSVKVDPSLIAGIVIRVGDRVYDGSVHNQLERARTAMIDRATEQIETRPESFMVA